MPAAEPSEGGALKEGPFAAHGEPATTPRPPSVQQAALAQVLPPVVHEMRNALAVLSMALDLADSRLASCSPTHAPLRAQVAPVLQRAGAMLTDLLSLARSQPVTLGPLNLVAVLDKFAAEAQPARQPHATLGEGEGQAPPAVRVHRRSDANPIVWGDSAALTQALGHVVRNAAEAVSSRRGRIDLELAPTRKGWQVRVLDDGPGVAAELRRHLFAPFFSTKPRHLGIGLALARHCMQAQAGSLALTEHAARRYGHGASFCLTLPHAPPLR